MFTVRVHVLTFGMKFIPKRMVTASSETAPAIP